MNRKILLKIMKNVLKVGKNYEKCLKILLKSQNNLNLY